MLIDQRFHLTYCANVHPGESWQETFAQLETHLPAIKKSVSPKKPFGTGLYLSDRASRELLEGEALKTFQSWLEKEQLYIFTMNGFPFGGFHRSRVKDSVYLPDWTTRERVDFTKRLFHILSELLPQQVDGGISTSPVSYKYWFANENERAAVMKKSAMHFIEIALFLRDLSAKTGKSFHLDIEPEPDCFLENADETVAFFNEQLIPAALEHEKIIREHIRLCYDVCHFSVEYEVPAMAIDKLISNDIRIGKIQISAAMKALLPDEKQSRQNLLNRFRQFDEPRYLHQTVVRHKNKTLRSYRDLSLALSACEPDDAELRTHFHVPLFVNEFDGLQSTQDDVVETLNILKHNNCASHLEVETYTWDVLPPALKSDLTSSVIRELQWVQSILLPQ